MHVGMQGTQISRCAIMRARIFNRFAQQHKVPLRQSCNQSDNNGFTVPLCRTHHRDIHSFGDEVAWWEKRAIDPVATARMLWITTRRLE